jgi:hypothetical protein
MDEPNQSGVAVPAAAPRRTFLVAGIVAIVLALAGFGPGYGAYMAGQFQIAMPAHLHGVLMVGWLAILLRQAVLARRRQLDAHRRLGRYGMALGVVMWLSMLALTVRGLAVYDVPEGSYIYDVMITQLYLATVFPLLLAAAWLHRHRPDWHKRFIVLATILVLQAAVDRMFWLPQVLPGYWAAAFYLDLLLVVVAVADWRCLRRVHGATLVGSALILAGQTVTALSVKSPAWHHFAFGLARQLRAALG